MAQFATKMPQVVIIPVTQSQPPPFNTIEVCVDSDGSVFYRVKIFPPETQFITAPYWRRPS
jgi:hypothetical protein